MLLEILKIVLPLLGGGVAGALLNEWFRRRGGRVQAIPLIERVNRLVSPELKGFTLARVTDDGRTRRIEEIRNVREYQFTLQNTSSIHLQDVEIQFEFPTEDVEAWAERPALSKTAPVPVDAVATEPWKKGYRWRIPQFPATDSVEFTFRAIDPPSGAYEVALYKCDRVVVEKSKGEPSRRRQSETFVSRYAAPITLAGFVGLVVSFATSLFFPTNKANLDTLSDWGCTLTVESAYKQFEPAMSPWHGPWLITHRILNVGSQKCVVQSDQLTGPPAVLEVMHDVTRTAFSLTKPKLVQGDLSLGPEGPTHKTRVTLYATAPP